MRDQFHDCFAGLSADELTPEMYVEILKMLDEVAHRFPVRVQLSLGKRHKKIIRAYEFQRWRRNESVRKKLRGYVRQFIADERKRLTQESPDKRPPNWRKNYAVALEMGDTAVELRKKLAVIGREGEIERLIRKAEEAVPQVAPPERVDGLLASEWIDASRRQWKKKQMLSLLTNEQSAASHPSAKERAAMRRTFSKKGRSSSRYNKGDSTNPTTSA